MPDDQAVTDANDKIRQLQRAQQPAGRVIQDGTVRALIQFLTEMCVPKITVAEVQMMVQTLMQLPPVPVAKDDD
jgi:hypothetical protein